MTFIITVLSITVDIQMKRCETTDKGVNKLKALQSSISNLWWRTYGSTHNANANTHTHTQSALPWCAYLCTPVTGCVSGMGEGEGNEEEEHKLEEKEGRLTTCLASSKDVCSLLISFPNCSFILCTSWSWAATSSFRAPFRAVSSLSRLFSTSSCSSLAKRSSCISSFSCIMSWWRRNI